MKIRSKPFLLLVLVPALLNLPAFAGGVSDGGGSIPISEQARPEWIANSASHDAALVLTGWLYNEETSYLRRTAEEREASPFHVLFSAGAKDVFSIIRETRIELRMAAPCADANGTPTDGSVFSPLPHSICISPFSMAPKLTEFNYGVETIALITHELSHLAGADEAQARLLQRQALLSLSHSDFTDFAVEVMMLSGSEFGARGKIAEIGNELGSIAFPAAFAQDFAPVRDEYSKIGIDIEFGSLKFQPLRQSSLDLLNAEAVRLEILRDGNCALAPDGINPDRGYCSYRIEKAFGDANSATAQVVSDAWNDHREPLPRSDEVLILRPRTVADLDSEREAFQRYLASLKGELRTLLEFNFHVIRTTAK